MVEDKKTCNVKTVTWFESLKFWDVYSKYLEENNSALWSLARFYKNALEYVSENKWHVDNIYFELIEKLKNYNVDLMSIKEIIDIYRDPTYFCIKYRGSKAIDDAL